MTEPAGPQGFEPPRQPSHWPAQPGSGLPAVPDPATVPGPTMVTIGDIICTRTEVITPSGRRPINAVSWTFTDMSQTSQSIPAWAIVLAIVFFLFCFLGLLFLLAKEERTTGWVQVTVQGNQFLHNVQLPVAGPQQVADYNARVNYARSLSASF